MTAHRYTGKYCFQAGVAPWPFALAIHGGGFKSGDPGLPFNVCAQDLVNAGYFVACPEYRLAPPGQLVGQTSDGRFPDQTNDVMLAVAKAKADLRCNGEVFAVGGSAGASHSAWLAGKHLVNAAVLMSPAMQFNDPVSLKNSNFNHDVNNYAPNNLSAASPLGMLTTNDSPIFVAAYQQDSMPAPQYNLTVADLVRLGAPHNSLLLAGQGHSFDMWPTIKDQAIAFLNAHRGHHESNAYTYAQPKWDGHGNTTVGYANTESSDSDFLLARLNPRGSLDPTFGVRGRVRTSFGDLNGGANGAALQSDGKIVAVGFQATFSNQWTNFALARYLGQ